LPVFCVKHIYPFSITYSVFVISNSKVPLIVGENIRRLREARGISLGELARKAGVSKSTLSAIEAGGANPTISTLWAISKALGVPFSSLVSEGIIIEEGGIHVRLVERGTDTEVYVMKLRPKALRDAAPHQEGVEEFVIVAEGSALIGPKEGPKYLREFETLSFRGDVPHIYASPDQDSTLIVILRYGGGSR